MNTKTLFLILLVCGLVGAGTVNAAFDKGLEPVIVLGSECGTFLGQSIDDVRVYVYTAGTDAWAPVPFQVDEFEPDNDPEKDKKVVWDGDGILSALDEIVFMGKDVGDKVPSDTNWPGDEGVKGNMRYEIAITDPVTMDSAFAYIYYSAALAKNQTAYVSYKDDYVKGQVYGIGHDTSNAGGLPDSLAIAGNNIDFLDSWRIRAFIRKIVVNADLGVGGKLPFTGKDIYFSEEMDTQFDLKYSFITVTVNAKAYHEKSSLKVKAGPVRILREHTLAIRFWTTGMDDTSRIPILIKYYDNSVDFKPTFSLNLGDDVEEIDAAFVSFAQGLNVNAMNVKFYGDGFVNADGKEDSLIDKDPTNEIFKRVIGDNDWPGHHWFGYSGQPSSVVNNASFFQIVDLNGDMVDPGNPAFSFYDYTQGGFDPNGVYGVSALKIYDWSSPPAETFEIDANIRSYYFAKNSSRSEFQASFEKYENKSLLGFTEQRFPDLVPPGRITDLAITDRADESMTIQWTARGDDGDEGGPASYYVIRYSTAAPENPDGNDWAWWSGATNIPDTPPAPAEPGIIQSVVVTGLSEATVYYFRMNVVDHGKNAAGLSNTATSWTTPVELAYFGADIKDNLNVYLNWSTASETNNLGFSIERRFDDDEQWKEIGFVKGAGTTAQEQNYSYVDAPAKSGTWHYRLKQLDTNGAFEYSHPIDVSIATPQKFALNQNYPNPFNPETTISFEVPEAAEGQMMLIVYDMLGRQVRSLVEKNAEAGYYNIKWDGYDDTGVMTSSGVYIYRLRAGEFTATKKMIKLQ